MGFRRYIKYFLVHSFGFTNKEAYRLILGGRIKVNNDIITENREIDDNAEIYLDDRLLKEKRKFTYIAFYKPRGIETTHNKNIEHNLTTVFPLEQHLAFAGRLDKESEGLLILSDNGKYVQALASPFTEKEKEYLVTVNKPISPDFVQRMSQGIDIVIGTTRPCFVEQLGDLEFRIILKEGKNRQIRRMCKACGYIVNRLIRVRIDTIKLEDLQPGEFRYFEPFE